MTRPPRHTPDGPRSGTCTRGFTLLEVLVALVVLATALSAAYRASGVAVQATEELRLRLLADVVANNRLAMLRADQAWPEIGHQEREERQGNEAFRWTQDVSPTPNSLFRRVDVRVFLVGSSHELARLTGFATAPGTH